MVKKCTKCKETKNISFFAKNKYSKDGYRSNCKNCSSGAKRKWYESHKELTNKRSREWKQNNPERARELNRSYQLSEEAKERRKNRAAQYKKENPIRTRAGKKVRKAVKAGVIIKPILCECCNIKTEKQKMHGHHEDYNKPLNVVWLCPICHSLTHNGKTDQAEAIRCKILEIYDLKYNKRSEYGDRRFRKRTKKKVGS